MAHFRTKDKDLTCPIHFCILSASHVSALISIGLNEWLMERAKLGIYCYV